MKVHKILLLTNILSPYRFPVWEELSKRFENFKVIALSKTEKNRNWQANLDKYNFKTKVLKGIHFFFTKHDWGFHINPGIFFLLIKENPKVIILTGYDTISFWVALVYAKIFCKKIVFWNGSTLLSNRHTGKFTRLIKKIFIKRANAFITYGTLAKEYLLSFGIPQKKISVGCNTVDCEELITYYIKNRNKKEQIKKQLALFKFNFIFIGQLIERKGVIQLIEAFKEIVTENKNVGLIIVGTGPLKKYLENKIHTENIENIKLVGYKAQDILKDYLIASDVLIMPSLIEVWGLVVNEAMSFALPVIVSKYSGAAVDLVVEGENGFIIDPNNKKDIVFAMKKILLNKKKCINMGVASLEKIKKCTPKVYAEAVIKSVLLATDKKFSL